MRLSLDLEKDLLSIDRKAKNYCLDQSIILSMYYREVKKYSPLSAEEERKLSKEMREEFKKIITLLSDIKIDCEEIRKAKEEIERKIARREKFELREDDIKNIKKFLEIFSNRCIDSRKRVNSRQYKIFLAISGAIKRVEAIRDHFVKSNLRLVFNTSRQYLGYGVDLMDLIQEGNVGLIKAVYRYDGERGFRFSTYAIWWIKFHMIKYLLKRSSVVKLPFLRSEVRKLITEAMERFKIEYNREATIEELAEYTGIKEEDVKKAFGFGYTILWLDAPINGDERGKELKDFFEAGRDTFEIIANRDIRVVVRELLRDLSAREEKVIRLRYGLGDRGPLKLECIGRELGLSGERIRQIEERAIRKIRQRIRKKMRESILL